MKGVERTRETFFYNPRTANSEGLRNRKSSSSRSSWIIEKMPPPPGKSVEELLQSKPPESAIERLDTNLYELYSAKSLTDFVNKGLSLIKNTPKEIGQLYGELDPAAKETVKKTVSTVLSTQFGPSAPFLLVISSAMLTHTVAAENYEMEFHQGNAPGYGTFCTGDYPHQYSCSNSHATNFQETILRIANEVQREYRHSDCKPSACSVLKDCMTDSKIHQLLNATIPLDPDNYLQPLSPSLEGSEAVDVEKFACYLRSSDWHKCYTALGLDGATAAACRDMEYEYQRLATECMDESARYQNQAETLGIVIGVICGIVITCICCAKFKERFDECRRKDKVDTDSYTRF